MAPAGVVEALDEVEDRHAGLGLVRSAAPDGHVEGVQDQLGARCSAIDQPTTRREKASRITASYSQPSPVRCWV